MTKLVRDCPAAARREQQDSLVRLGAMDAAVRRLSAGGRCGGAAATLLGALAEGRPDVAGAAVAAGAVPRLVRLLGEPDDRATNEAAAALMFVIGRPGSPAAAAAVDAGAVRSLAGLTSRAGASGVPLSNSLLLLAWLTQTPAGAERLVADGALPHVVRLLRSPEQRVAYAAGVGLLAATRCQALGAAAEALLADAAATAALVALVLAPDHGAPFCAACVLAKTMAWAVSPEALGRARGLAAAVRRAGAVPRLVELLRAAVEEELYRDYAPDVIGCITYVCMLDAAAARDALGAGAWREARRVVLQEDARAERADEGLVGLGLSVLADLTRHLRGGAPRPAAAAEPGLFAALARALGRAAARGGGSGRLPSGSDRPRGGRQRGGVPGGSAGGLRRGRACRRVRPRGRCRPPGAGSLGLHGRRGAGWICEARAKLTFSLAVGLQDDNPLARPSATLPQSPCSLPALCQRLSHPRSAIRPTHRIHSSPTHHLHLNPPAARGAAGDARRRRAVGLHGVGGEGPGTARVRPRGAGRIGRGGRAGGRSGVAAGGLGAGARRGARDAAAPARARAGAARRRPRAAAVRRLRRARVARPAAQAVCRLPRPRALVQRRVPAERLGGPQGRVPGEEGGGGGGSGGGRFAATGVKVEPRSQVWAACRVEISNGSIGVTPRPQAAHKVGLQAPEWGPCERRRYAQTAARAIACCGGGHSPHISLRAARRRPHADAVARPRHKRASV
jgi:hypothetical protein